MLQEKEPVGLAATINEKRERSYTFNVAAESLLVIFVDVAESFEVILRVYLLRRLSCSSQVLRRHHSDAFVPHVWAAPEIGKKKSEGTLIFMQLCIYLFVLMKKT